MLLARRILEQANQRKDGKLMMLALDWAKAFDNIAPARLIIALKRFGIPDHMVSVIAAICENRRFYVKLGQNESE